MLSNRFWVSGLRVPDTAAHSPGVLSLEIQGYGVPNLGLKVLCPRSQGSRSPI